jgi:lysozyme family protein
MADFNVSIQKILDNEGGLSENPMDRGGKTRYGISQKSYPNEYIDSLTIERAKFLYERDYWNPILGNQIMSQEVADSLLDFAVNAGIKTAVKLAQSVVGVDADGSVGKDTIYAINTYSPKLFLAEFKLAKIQKYVDICLTNSSQKTFFFGWIIRSLK